MRCFQCFSMEVWLSLKYSFSITHREEHQCIVWNLFSFPIVSKMKTIFGKISAMSRSCMQNQGKATNLAHVGMAIKKMFVYLWESFSDLTWRNVMGAGRECVGLASSSRAIETPRDNSRVHPVVPGHQRVSAITTVTTIHATRN